MRKGKKYAPAKALWIFLLPTLILILCFCFFFHSQVSADSGDVSQITSVRSILVKKGETLTSIARKYAPEYSHFSAKEYTENILLLNNMDSEHIEAGHYILLPNYQ